MSHREDIEKLITLYHRRLQKLKEQQAIKGISTPPEILIEIEDIEAKIEQLTGLQTEQSEVRQVLTGLSSGTATFEMLQSRLAAIEQQLQNLAASAPTFDQRHQKVRVQYNVKAELGETLQEYTPYLKIASCSD